MLYRYVLAMLTFAVMLFSCRKNQGPDGTNQPPEPPVLPAKHILLKDIIIPHLPSPYYHFEYNEDSLVNKANFDSGLLIYDLFYDGTKIREMRNNIIVNHDTLRYSYDNTGKPVMIKFINDANVVYRLVFFTYDGNRISKIEWDRKEGTIGYLIDRTVTFTFYPDDNLETMTDHRPADQGSPEQTLKTTFEQYDEKINVDDFSLVHDGIHDHLFLFQGFRLQKGNPAKETFSVDGVDYYTVDYTWVYNSDNTPSTKNGVLLFKSGADAGKTFQISTTYTYY